MTLRLFGISATVAAVTLATALVAAQDRTSQDQVAGAPAVQDQAPPAQGPIGQGRGLGPGRGLGQGQGLGPGRGFGQGQRLGRGRQRAVRGGAIANRGRGPGGRLAALDLTDDQRAAITELQRAARDQAAPLRDELEFARKTLHRELFADARDGSTIANLMATIAELEGQLADLHVSQATAVADALTADQREIMRLREGRGPGRGAGRGRGRGGPAAR
jgi:Spy/CpxP family protein refolding chaperone